MHVTNTNTTLCYLCFMCKKQQQQNRFKVDQMWRGGGWTENCSELGSSLLPAQNRSEITKGQNRRVWHGCYNHFVRSTISSWNTSLSSAGSAIFYPKGHKSQQKCTTCILWSLCQKHNFALKYHVQFSSFTASWSHLSVRTTNSPVELFALQHKTVFTGLDDATLRSNWAGSVDVVTGDHAHKDSCMLATADGLWHLWNR